MSTGVDLRRLGSFNAYVVDRPSSVQSRKRSVDTEKAEAAIRQLLAALGFDGDHPALAGTPQRALEALNVLTAGYETSAEEALGEGFSVSDQTPVVATRIATQFVCPHHLLAAQAEVHLAFIPKDRVPGLSRLCRFVDAEARRLILQEDLTQELADGLMRVLDAEAAAVVVEATHGCVATEDFARRDARFATHTVRGESGESLLARIGATLAEPWATSA